MALAIKPQRLLRRCFSTPTAAPVLALGAAGAVPGSLGVVQGDGEIPYKPEALAKKRENAENWIDRDPELKCYLPGIPRAMYLPHPFQITQSTDKIHIAYSFSNTARTIHMDKVEPPRDQTWMGHSVGRWEGDTLVIDTIGLQAKNSYLDWYRTPHTEKLHVVERFRLADGGQGLEVKVHVEDPGAFTTPWDAVTRYRIDRRDAEVPLHEMLCAENNEDHFSQGLVPIPQADKADF